jgi:hypothetical protein
LKRRVFFKGLKKSVFSEQGWWKPVRSLKEKRVSEKPVKKV